MLAGVNAAQPSDPPGMPGTSGPLGRVRGLVDGLIGPLGNGDMLAWASPCEADAVSRELFALIAGAGLFDDWGPDLPPGPPAGPDELMARLWEIDEAAATDRLAGLIGTSLAYGTRGRRAPGEAGQLAADLAGLLGGAARWWSNTDLTSWNPVTRHTFDGLVVGAGHGVIVAVLAVDED